MNNIMVKRYYLFTFFISLHFFAAVLVPFFTDWGGISKTQMQFLQSWFMFWIFILEIPTGVIADYFGRKYSLILGSLAITFGALIYGSIPNFQIFLLAEFLFAAAFALISGADKALLYDTLKEQDRQHESKKVFGRAHSIMLFAFMIAAPVGSLLAGKFGINTPMLFEAVPFLIATCIALTLREPKIHDKTSESKRYVDIAKKGFVFFYKHKILRLIALDSIIVASAAYFVIWLYQQLLESIGVPIAYFGFVHLMLVAVEILISTNFGLFEKLFKSSEGFLRFSSLITGIAFILVAIYPNTITILLFIIFAGGFGLTRLELMTNYMNHLIPSAQRATILSSISMFRRLALVVLNPFIGFTADHSLRGALLIVGLLPLAVFFFSPIKKEMFENQ